MSRQVTRTTNDQRLQRVLAALEAELLQASDEEVRRAARDIGIDPDPDPDMKGSIAWLGIFHSTSRRIEDVFDMEAVRGLLLRRLKPPQRRDQG
jgi:hypothetical protein